MNNNPVPLDRRFSLVPRSADDSDEMEFFNFLGNHNLRKWSEIDKRFRSVILAEAGAGKTFEMFARAEFIRNQDCHAFFIRIEDIAVNFEQAFEVGSEIEFEDWLDSREDAWFFLDSVDEARLSNPRQFERAIHEFARRIKVAQLHAHICISSRPYAWRPKSDPELIERYLPFNKPQAEKTDEDLELTEPSGPPESELQIFKLDPLDEADIRMFAEHRSVSKIDRLIEELERSNAMTMAERPFDLEGILDKWVTDRELGSRSELLQHNIDLRLKEIKQDDEIRRSMSTDRACEGARMIAAAVILCNESGIQVPDNTHEQKGLNAKLILRDWIPRDIQTLLERAIFNDVIYGLVRFRHREIREFLAAEWFAELLRKDNARRSIEALIFREQYGEQIVSLRLRPILPWLIIKDDNVRRHALAIDPGIALEGGDPARLSLPERKKIVGDVLAKIIREDGVRRSYDYSAIVGIAQPDLTDEIFSLLEKYIDHNNAVSFLGRLTWLGKMSKCVPPLLSVATDPKRSKYARIIAARSVMSLGTDEQGLKLWRSLLSAQVEIPRELLAELLDRNSADEEGVVLLLKAIGKLSPYKQFKVTGLRQALHGYIDRLPIENTDTAQPLTDLVCGLKACLTRPPLSERFSYLVSEEFVWLLYPAIHAIERLVSARTDAALQDDILDILLISPEIRESFGEHYDDYKDRLSELIPVWPKLNDTLFWRMVKTKRTRVERSGNQLNDYLQVLWPAHYWSFDSDSFLRVLEWLKTRKLEDDRLVALSLAFQIFTESRRPAKLLHQLRDAVADDATLVERLEELYNPTISEQEIKWQQQELHYRKKRKIDRQKREQMKSEWIDRLKANPELIRNPPGLNSGEISNDQVSLTFEIEDDSIRTSRTNGANWESLIIEFGEAVAHAYCDAAMSHWRHYNPGLPSEGADTSKVSHSLTFALAGLEIEARECKEFPAHLSESEVKHALRYTTWEINGFPSWLETMFQNQPQAMMNAILTEMIWDLDHTKPDQASYRILHDLVYYAPWLHHALIKPLQDWIRANDLPSVDTLRYCLHILKNGGMEPFKLANLAQMKIRIAQNNDLLPYWYAIWVDSEPDTGIPALTEWLEELDTDQCSHAAQNFSVALLDNGHRIATGPRIGNFQTAEHLKSLCVLMFTYIRVEDDIHRANTGVYSPGLRDDAQEARGRIIELLSEIPGKESYVALTKLITEHPNADYRSWMAEQAYKRAEKDGDLEPWTAAQVGEFNSQQNITPDTQRQLFELTINRLIQLKNWLEHGDTSPYKTWQKSESETEMRNLVAGWVDQNTANQFSLSQEPEISNKQRMDIWLQNPKVGYPIPIELKLLDTDWTGPKLCERLRNQLAGDYLSDGTERFGVMLLVWKGVKPAKRWRIGGISVGVSDLSDALKDYWDTIAYCYSKVSAIEVIVIDLTQKSIKSCRQD